MCVCVYGLSVSVQEQMSFFDRYAQYEVRDLSLTICVSVFRCNMISRLCCTGGLGYVCLRNLQAPYNI